MYRISSNEIRLPSLINLSERGRNKMKQRERFMGTWILVEFYIKKVNDTRTYPFGKKQMEYLFTITMDIIVLLLLVRISQVK